MGRLSKSNGMYETVCNDETEQKVKPLNYYQTVTVL